MSNKKVKLRFLNFNLSKMKGRRIKKQAAGGRIVEVRNAYRKNNKVVKHR